MTMLEDLLEVARLIHEFQNKEGPTIRDIDIAFTAASHAAYQFVERNAAKIEQDARDAERWRELCRQIDAEPHNGASVLHSILDDAVNMGAGCLERHINEAMAKESGNG